MGQEGGWGLGGCCWGVRVLSLCQASLLHTRQPGPVQSAHVPNSLLSLQVRDTALFWESLSNPEASVPDVRGERLLQAWAELGLFQLGHVSSGDGPRATGMPPI